MDPTPTPLWCSPAQSAALSCLPSRPPRVASLSQHPRCSAQFSCSRAASDIQDTCQGRVPRALQRGSAAFHCHVSLMCDNSRRLSLTVRSGDGVGGRGLASAVASQRRRSLPIILRSSLLPLLPLRPGRGRRPAADGVVFRLPGRRGRPPPPLSLLSPRRWARRAPTPGNVGPAHVNVSARAAMPRCQTPVYSRTPTPRWFALAHQTIFKCRALFVAR